MFNMQSGIHRRVFHGAAGHTKAVTAICSDSLNQFLISTSLDGTIKIWNFNDGQLHQTLDLGTPITHMVLHYNNHLIAVASDDLAIRVLDFDTRKWVRHYVGHWSRITDLCFSPDARWIVSASLDSTVRVWDLPSGFMVDWFKVDSLITSLSFSPTGNFLASTHVDHLGICLWSNRTHYMPITLTSVSEDEPYRFELDKVMKTMTEEKEEGEEETLWNHADYQTPQQLAESMVTLSTLPQSKWQNLLHLDIIKQRNKPRKPPKTPEKAPFFLPTLSAIVQPTFAVSNDHEHTSHQHYHTSRVGISNTNENDFQKMLRLSTFSDDSEEQFMKQLKEMPPSQIDAELRLLPSRDDLLYFNCFLQFLCRRLESCKDFELVESYLHVFIKVKQPTKNPL
jgi:U3 small nucleolar RNA-associated protein 21